MGDRGRCGAGGRLGAADDSQYSGAKAALRPIYDALALAISDLGDDVTIEGRSTYTPFVRGRQFAAIAPAARDRVDLGLRFTDPPPPGRARPASSPGQATHKISLRSVPEVDDEVLGLLQQPTTRTHRSSQAALPVPAGGVASVQPGSFAEARTSGSGRP